MTDIRADDWPSFSEELTRKTLQTLEKWLVRHQAGKITERELFILVDALFDTVSGIVDMKALDLLAEVHEEIRQHAKRR